MSRRYDILRGDRRGNQSVLGYDSGISPGQLPNVYAWYRSDTGITIGTGVAGWDDQVGTNDITQSVVGAQPPYTNPFVALNNQPVVGVFDGTADFMRAPLGLEADWSFLHNGTGSTIIVYGGTGALGAARRIIDTNGGSATASGVSVAVNATGNILWNVGTGALPVIGAASAALPANTPFYCICRSSSAVSPNWSYTVNGVTSSGANTNPPGASNPLYVPNIGRRGSGSHFYNGVLAEVAFVKRYITDQEVSRLVAYFARYVP